MSRICIINILFGISNTYLILFLSISTYIHNCIIARMHFRCHDVTMREFRRHKRRLFPIPLTGPIGYIRRVETAADRWLIAVALSILKNGSESARSYSLLLHFQHITRVNWHYFHVIIVMDDGHEILSTASLNIYIYSFHYALFAHRATQAALPRTSSFCLSPAAILQLPSTTSPSAPDHLHSLSSRPTGSFTISTFCFHFRKPIKNLTTVFRHIVYCQSFIHLRRILTG